MQVKSITNQNRQPKFDGIYQPQNANFNKVQRSVANSIKKSMRKPVQNFNGETSECFYKKRGFDFLLSPTKNDTVTLHCIEDAVPKGENSLSYSGIFKIGTYGAKNKFNKSNINKKIEQRNNNKILANNIMVGLLIIGLYGAAAVASLNKRQPARTKQLIEKIDGVANNAKDLIPDTTFANTKVLKPIKK